MKAPTAQCCPKEAGPRRKPPIRVFESRVQRWRNPLSAPDPARDDANFNRLLGHNLGLRHGGNIDCNGKLNYNSLMNYNHQFAGIDVDCQIGGDGPDYLGYSEGIRPTMIQGQLDEAQGLCPLDHPLHSPIDWNGNGIVDQSPVSYSGQWTVGSECFGLTVAEDFNDYAALVVDPSSPPSGAPIPSDDSGQCATTP